MGFVDAAKKRGLSASEPTIRVKVPLPFPLRWVNSYLVRGRDGYTLIDPGLHTPEGEQVWEEALSSYGIRYGDIEQIVLTHHHPDHYGLAGWFQERSGAPVWISEEGQRQAERMWTGSYPMNRQVYDLFICHGMDTDTAAKLHGHFEGFLPLVHPMPARVSFYDREKPFALGTRNCEVIHTPGHAYGHVCFYDREHKEMFCGDHVLPRISPNVSFIPDTEINPLQSYLESLSDISRYEVIRAYPGHRDPFESFTERASALVIHHEERLAEMERRLPNPRTVYELCLDIFGERLTMHQLRFAMAETLAHVIYLHKAERVAETEQDGVLFYQSSRE
ncbi:MBL fold metallo-hydrolase [Paenibacillus sp. J2TS4]|uniref:MBL fold metallo-hydrolase n=1 Tax=Paenibacillus sp. J2TS4 TaxID=2807194 RepID=UPI001B26692B|nr:MBL fold metallo-hydrolase [Paenibacillus sp. J2TS4]GIP31310.1 MBL fold hydrolase [Paenibacillus sp. J2TS4]